MDFFRNLKNRRKIRICMTRGQRLQQEKDPEGAYAQYLRAAELGSTDAMVCIASMYYADQFRPLEYSDLLELIRQGIPVFPWNTVTRKIPDYPSALNWFRKAADLGHGSAACMTGSMLCQGIGCKPDKVSGMRYLKMAVDAGIREARQALCVYGEHEKRRFTREEYEEKLKVFSDAAEAGQEEAYFLYDQLMGGSETQLARLGYVITAAQNSGKTEFSAFPYAVAQNGIPLVPVCWKRGNWQSFVRVDLNALASDDVKIAVSMDIDPEYTLEHSHRLVRAGTAVYRSGEFGWLGETKHAVLYRVDRNARLEGETLESLLKNFRLTEAEYAPDNAAFFTECGEKEYSVEIAAVTGDRVDVLLRYTVGGSDTVKRNIPPELISMTEE